MALVVTLVGLLFAVGDAMAQCTNPRVGLNGNTCAYNSIADAFAHANPGDEVYLAPGDYPSAPFTIDAATTPTTFRGATDCTCTTTASGSTTAKIRPKPLNSRAIDVTAGTTARFLAVQLDGSGTVSDGGVIYLSEGAGLGLVDAVVAGGDATGNGGCIFGEGSNVVSMVGATRVTGCHADGDGGAVYLQALGLLFMEDAILGPVVDAGGSGGAVFADNSTVLMLDGSFIDGGSAGLDGGGIFGLDSTIDLFDAAVRNSSAGGSGGGIGIEGGSVLVSGPNASVHANDALLGGGIAVIEHGTVTLDGSTVRNNVAAGGGGGVSVTGDLGAILFDAVLILQGGAVIEDNEALAGGGVAAAFRALVDATNSAIQGNTATFAGGGIHLQGSTASLDGADVNDNSADSGGGVYLLQFNGTPSILGLTNGAMIDFNDATSTGGGVHVVDDISSVSLDDSGVEGNTSGGDGAGIYCDDAADITLSGNAGIALNLAGGSGGGIHSAGVVTLLDNAGIKQNMAGGDGGGIHAPCLRVIGSQWQPVLDPLGDAAGGVRIDGNEAEGSGGGAYIDAGLTCNRPELDAENLIVINNSAAVGGGGLYLNGVGRTPQFGDALLNNSIVSNNEAANGGGANLFDSDLTTGTVFPAGLIVGCLPQSPLVAPEWENRYCSEFTFNRATSGRGGAFYVQRSNLDAFATAISGNEASTGAAALLITGVTPTNSRVEVRQSLVSDNVVTVGPNFTSVQVDPSQRFIARHTTFAETAAGLDVRYAPGAKGSLLHDIFWGGAPNVGELDLQGAGVAGICNVGNLLGVSGFPLVGANNDDLTDPEFTDTASNPTVNARGLYHVDGSTTAVDQCVVDGVVDLDGNPRPVGAGPPAFDRGAFEAQ